MDSQSTSDDRASAFHDNGTKVTVESPMDSAVIEWVDKVFPLDCKYTDLLPTPPDNESCDAYSLGLRVLEFRLMAAGGSAMPPGRVEWARLHLMRLYADAYRRRMDKKISALAEKNLCMICLADLGFDNPRQLCQKTSCSYSNGFDIF